MGNKTLGVFQSKMFTHFFFFTLALFNVYHDALQCSGTLLLERAAYDLSPPFLLP